VNLPNALTALRIFLVPWLVVLLLTRTEWGWFLGLVVFTIAVITDYFDGWLARRRNEQTKLGAMLDPLADKLLLSAAFLSLIELEMAPAWIVAVIVLAAATLAGGISTFMSGDQTLAAGLVAGGMLVILLVVLKWQPFKRAARSAQLAEMADAMATNLRLRMRALEEMDDAKARQLEQWKAVVDLTAGVKGTT